MLKSLRTTFASLIAITLVLIGLACNEVGISNPAPLEGTPDSGVAESDHASLQEAYDAIKSRHIRKDELTDSFLHEAAIRGMIAALDDPYAYFMDPEQFAIRGDYSGKFQGIGAEITVRNGSIMIVAPIAGSPAEQAGILPGDIVLSVDGESLIGKTIIEAVVKVRGPKGTPVTLEVIHNGDVSSTSITIVRDVITIPSAEWRMVEPGIGYIRIRTFQKPTTSQVRRGLQELLSDGSATGIILDLRDNGGGLLSTAIEITSQFIESGTALWSVNSKGERTEYSLEDNGVALTVPLVVLGNQYSASASEIVIGALQDHNRAPFVGMRTFGKGSVGTVMPLSGGAGISFTTSRWLTPNGTLIEGNGLNPDFTVGSDNTDSLSEDQREIYAMAAGLCTAYGSADIEPADLPDIRDVLLDLCDKSIQTTKSDADVQLRAAIDRLKLLIPKERLSKN